MSPKHQVRRVIRLCRTDGAPGTGISALRVESTCRKSALRCSATAAYETPSENKAAGREQGPTQNTLQERRLHASRYEENMARTTPDHRYKRRRVSYQLGAALCTVPAG